MVIRVIALKSVTDFAWLEPVLRLLKAEVLSKPDLYRPKHDPEKVYPAITVQMDEESWSNFSRLSLGHNAMIFATE
jgi:hypothetical protein